jgi:hypothetical protein
MDSNPVSKIGNHIEAISIRGTLTRSMRKKTICLRPCMRWLGNCKPDKTKRTTMDMSLKERNLMQVEIDHFIEYQQTCLIWNATTHIFGVSGRQRTGRLSLYYPRLRL